MEVDGPGIAGLGSLGPSGPELQAPEASGAGGAAAPTASAGPERKDGFDAPGAAGLQSPGNSGDGGFMGQDSAPQAYPFKSFSGASWAQYFRLPTEIRA